MIKLATTLTFLLMIQSCSLGPFSSGKTGRSYGAGNTQFEVGSANSSYYLKLGFGASADLDVGYVMEFGGFSTSGLFLKYSLLNQATGGSHALEAGYGGTDSSSYYYGGLVSSLAFNNSFELFINPRLVSVTTDEADVELGKTVGNVIVEDYELTYLYTAAGINLWFNNVFGLSIYTIYISGEGLKTEESFTNAATAMFRF